MSYVCLIVFCVVCLNFGIHAFSFAENTTLNKKTEMKYEKFLVPKSLKKDDEISLVGEFTDDTEWIKFTLVSSIYEKDILFTCQYEANFVNNTMYLIRGTNKTGYQKEDIVGMKAKDLILDNKFNVTFRMESEDSIGFHVLEAVMGSNCELERGIMDQIHIVTVQGVSVKVEMITFKFA